MRIGFIIDTFDVGGSELNAIKVGEALTELGHALTVFHFQKDGPLRERYVSRGIELQRVPISGLVSRSAFSAARSIQSTATARGITVLHSHCVYSNVVGAIARRLTLHARPLLASRRWNNYAERPGLHRLNALAQSAADAVLVNSPGLARVVERESPFAKTFYVPNLLPDSFFARLTHEERRAARSALGLPADGLVVGCVARLSPVKDHRTLLDAWKMVLQQLPDATLAVVGDGNQLEALEIRARELGISERVIFTGEILPPNIPHRLFDVFALSSLDEGFPNSLLEAMACGVPIVSTRVGGVPDLVEHGVNGLLVDARDASSLAGAIRELLTNPTTASKLVANASVTAGKHQQTQVVGRLLEVYGAIGSA